MKDIELLKKSEILCEIADMLLNGQGEKGKAVIRNRKYGFILHTFRRGEEEGDLVDSHTFSNEREDVVTYILAQITKDIIEEPDK